MTPRLLPLFLLLLAAPLACRRPEPAPRVLRVEVPVAVPCPPPPVVVRPHLPIASLKADTTPEAAIRLRDQSIALLMGYARQLEAILAAYAPQTGGAR